MSDPSLGDMDDAWQLAREAAQQIEDIGDELDAAREMNETWSAIVCENAIAMGKMLDRLETLSLGLTEAIKLLVQAKFPPVSDIDRLISILGGS